MVTEEKKKYTCKYCGKEFDDPLEIGQHVASECPNKPPRVYICKYCGEVFDSSISLARHVQRDCEAAKAEKKREVKKKEEMISVYKTGEEVDVRAILEDILTTHPDIPARVRDEIMSWFDLKGGLSPSEVYGLLLSMRGISHQTAHIVSMKYSYALQKAYEEVKGQPPFPLLLSPQQPTQQPPPPLFPPIPSQQPTYPMIPISPPQPQQQQRWTPQLQLQQPQQYQQPQWIQQSYQPREDTFLRASIDRIESMIKRLEERISKLEKGGEEKLVRIAMPVYDPQGNIVMDAEGKPVLTYVEVPPHLAPLLYQMAQPRIQQPAKEDKMVGIVESRIKELTDEVKKREERIRQLENKINEVTSNYEKRLYQKDLEYEKKERERLEEQLKDLQAQLQKLSTEMATRKTVEGYETEIGKAISQGIEVIRERRPFEKAIETIKDLATPYPKAGPTGGLVGRISREFVEE